MSIFICDKCRAVEESVKFFGIPEDWVEIRTAYRTAQYCPICFSKLYGTGCGVPKPTTVPSAV